jgi:hypothetical protein
LEKFVYPWHWQGEDEFEKIDESIGFILIDHWPMEVEKRGQIDAVYPDLKATIGHSQ